MAKVDFTVRFSKIPKGQQEQYLEFIQSVVFGDEFTAFVNERLDFISTEQELEKPLRLKNVKQVSPKVKVTVAEIMELIAALPESFEPETSEDTADTTKKAVPSAYEWTTEPGAEQPTVTFNAKVFDDSTTEDASEQEQLSYDLPDKLLTVAKELGLDLAEKK